MGDGVLVTTGAVTYPHRVADILDTDLIDGHAAGIYGALYVFDGGAGGFGHGLLPLVFCSFLVFVFYHRDTEGSEKSLFP